MIVCWWTSTTHLKEIEYCGGCRPVRRTPRCPMRLAGRWGLTVWLTACQRPEREGTPRDRGSADGDGTGGAGGRPPHDRRGGRRGLPARPRDRHGHIVRGRPRDG